MPRSKKVTTRKTPSLGHYYGIPEKAQEQLDKKKRAPPKKKIRKKRQKTMYA